MKKIKILFVLIAFSLTGISCLVDDEADADKLGETPHVVGFNKAQETVSYFEDVGSVELDFIYEVKGGSIGSTDVDLSVTIEIDPSSTAVQGNEFDIASLTGTINADSDFGNLRINVNTGSLDPDAPTTLILNLVSENSSVAVADSFRTLTIIFIGCQSQLAGNYSNPDLPSGAGGVTEFVETSANNFTFTMPFLGFGGTDPVEMYMVDICGEISLTGWEVETAVSGTVVLDDVTGTVTINDLIIYNNGNVDPDDIWFDLGNSTYTPL